MIFGKSITTIFSRNSVLFLAEVLLHIVLPGFGNGEKKE